MAITYRGVTLEFGKHSGNVSERAIKQIAFPAVDGTEEMHFGKRQRSIIVTGLMTDIASGTLTPTILESWNDTGVGTLIVHGVSYTNCRAKGSWNNVRKDVVTGKMTAEYSIEFRKIQ